MIDSESAAVLAWKKTGSRRAVNSRCRESTFENRDFVDFSRTRGQAILLKISDTWAGREIVESVGTSSAFKRSSISFEVAKLFIIVGILILSEPPFCLRPRKRSFKMSGSPL